MNKYILKIAVALLVALFFGACSDDDDKNGGGTPVVRYIRPCDAAFSDSLLVRAYLGDRIAIIGENLGGVREIYFNDQKAKLNPSFVTEHAIIVSIPSTIPGEKQDIITLKTPASSVEYDFETLVPEPLISSMTCEYVSAGDIAYIQGYYFVHEEANPLTVTFPGNVEGEVVSYDVNNIAVKVPAGAQSGPITVTSVYGAGKSALHFRDQRNIILDFDTTFPDGGYHHGWHSGYGVGTENGVDGQYLIFRGENTATQPWMTTDKWNDTYYAYDRWTYRRDDPDFFDATALEAYVLKFEVNVTAAWSAAALQIIFTGADETWLNWQETSNGGNPGNAYVGDANYPRALWMPWVDAAGSTYKTAGWITVTIPMTDFKYNKDGGTVQVKPAGHYSGITLFVNGGGAEGTDCNPEFHIDNVRVVEKEQSQETAQP